MLVEGEKGVELAFSTYGPAPGKLPNKQEFAAVIVDKAGTRVASETLSVALDAEVTAVFASELETDGDPMEGGGEGCNVDWAPPVSVYAVNGKGDKVTKIVVSSGGLGYDAF